MKTAPNLTREIATAKRELDAARAAGDVLTAELLEAALNSLLDRYRTRRTNDGQ